MPTLADVVDFYNAGGGDIDNKSALLKPLNLSDEEQADLLAFLHTLTDRETLSWYNDAQETSLDRRTAGDGDVDRRMRQCTAWRLGFAHVHNGLRLRIFTLPVFHLFEDVMHILDRLQRVSAYRGLT